MPVRLRLIHESERGKHCFKLIGSGSNKRRFCFAKKGEGLDTCTKHRDSKAGTYRMEMGVAEWHIPSKDLAAPRGHAFYVTPCINDDEVLSHHQQELEDEAHPTLEWAEILLAMKEDYEAAQMKQEAGVYDDNDNDKEDW